MIAVLKRWFLLNDPIYQIWRAEAGGWNKGKSMCSSLHFKFLKEKSNSANRRSTEDFRAVKLLYMTLKGWIHIIMHLSKLIGCTPPRVNPDGSRVFG